MLTLLKEKKVCSFHPLLTTGEEGWEVAFLKKIGKREQIFFKFYD